MDRRIAVAEFLTATCAPAIARPELSITLPEIVPPATCARQALPVASTIAVTHAIVFLFIPVMFLRVSRVALDEICTNMETSSPRSFQRRNVHGKHIQAIE